MTVNLFGTPPWVWNINPGEKFMLLGSSYHDDDGDSRRTTDIVHYNGNIESGFNLQYDTE